MPLLDEKIRSDIAKVLDAMDSEVRLVSFTQEFECDSCHDARTLIDEVAGISEKLTHEVYDLVADKGKAGELGVDKVPATLVARDGAPRVRFYGVPAGYEFATLLEDIVSLSHDDSGLSDESREKLRRVDRPVHLQVLVTPTWPYCPRAVRLAHQLAMESDMITADMVELTEFPHLAQKYQVMGVPKTIINETRSVDGAVPEGTLVDLVLAALDPDGGGGV